jgi:uncharacterized RDD family membrane protein YckC
VSANASAQLRRQSARHSRPDPALADPPAGEPTEEQLSAGTGISNSERWDTPPLSGIAREFAERRQLEDRLQLPAGAWREEVANRVEGYRSRRSRHRLAGQFSMRLDFGPPCAPVQPPAEPGVMPSASTVATAVALPEPELAPPPPMSPVREQPRKPERQVKVIEFPRSLVFPEFAEPDPNELAESVLDKPRILDVPETLGAPPPPLAGIAYPSESEQDQEPELPVFELPLQVAPLAQRFTAALIDLVIVSTASVIFAGIVMQSITGLPHTKPFLGLAALVPVFFWAVYNYLFLVHGGATPGMTVNRLHLSSFTGDRISCPVRRWRALLMVLSCASLGMGFLWALFDQDALCWHDKMTQTYLTLDK